MVCTFGTLGEAHMIFALDFTARVFADEEPTSVALGITKDDFADVFYDVMYKSVLSGFSYAADTVGGISIILNIPYDQFLEVEYNVMSKIEPMFALFDALKYTPRDKCLYVFSIASDGGFASRLLRHAITEAKVRGFESILADCTNVKRQDLFAKLGFVTREEVTYGGFEHNGIYSFKNISGTKSIKRMELQLK